MSITIDPLSKLADHVYKEIKRSKKLYFQPSGKVIQELLEILYYASMNSEEGEMIKVRVAFFNPKELPPRVQKADRIKYIKFADPIKLDVKGIVKISKSADPWSTTLAVFNDESGELWINGLLDQALHAESYLNRETSVRPPQVGLFQVSIIGIGSLSVTKDYELIATYKQNTLVTNFIDVLRTGPIARLLKEKAKFSKEAIRNHLRENHKDIDEEEYDLVVDNSWRDSISRLLIQIRRYGHGGAFLITDESENIVPKYVLSYGRLRSSMLYLIKLRVDFDIIRNKLENHTGTSIKTTFFQNYLDITEKIKARENEVKGAIRFIASHSCVDGLILLNEELQETGYGAVVSTVNPPKTIYQAVDGVGTVAKLQPRLSAGFGTRHQSMITYCNENPGSIGFVISQDGDIRAFTKVEDKLLMWENIKTHKYLKTIPPTRLSIPSPPARKPTKGK